MDDVNLTDDDLIDMAKAVSLSSPCHRSQVGAVIVRRGKVIATGFNRAPRNQRDCSELGCYRDDNNVERGTHPELCRARGSHAEARAVALAARKGISTDGATMYIHGNTEVCDDCKALLVEAGIKMVVYRSKFGEIYKINTEYEWSINSLDHKKTLENWKKNMEKEKRNN